MSLTRRTFTLGAAAALPAAGVALPALAQQRGTVRLVVGYPPGGPADVIARALADPMKAALGGGTNVIVENRPGAGGRVAADQLRNAPPDGNTLLVSPASVITMAPHLFKSVRYELTRDFLPLAPIARLDLGLYAGPAVPAQVRTVADMVQWLKDTPSGRTCAIPGPGSTPHMAAMLIGRRTGIDWQLVPYQGDAPAFLALLAGQIPFHLGSLAGGFEHLKAGKVRMLALTTAERSTFAPDIPTFTQAGYDVVVEDRHSVFAGRQTPAAAIEPVRQALVQALGAREVKDMLQRMTLQPLPPTGDFAALLKAETDRWAAAIKALNISMEG